MMGNDALRELLSRLAHGARRHDYAGEIRTIIRTLR